MMAWLFLTINCQKILGMCQKICQALFSFMYLIFWWNHLKLSVVKISLIRFQTGFTPITKCLQNLSIQFVVLSFFFEISNFLHPIHFDLRQRILACVWNSKHNSFLEIPKLSRWLGLSTIWWFMGRCISCCIFLNPAFTRVLAFRAYGRKRTLVLGASKLSKTRTRRS